MDLDVERDVLPFLGAEAAAHVRALVEHPRNALALAAGQYGFRTLDARTGQARTLRGLTAVLEELYWAPEGSAPPPPPVARKRNLSQWDRAKHRRSAKPAVAAAPTGLSGTGRMRGTLVHGQLHDLLTLDARAFKRRNAHGTHPWAVRVMEALLQRGRRPVASELIVWSDAMRLGTAIDLVAVDCSAAGGGALEFCEVKTGYAAEGAWTRSSGPMRGCLAGVLDDTPLNRAIVQALVGALLAISGHALRGPFLCWVVRVDDAQVEFTRVAPDFVERHGPRIWAELTAHLVK